MTTVRTILAIVLLLFAAFVVLMNWIAVGVSLKNRKRGIDRHSSMVPLMSVVTTIGAYVLFPYRAADWMFVIPLLDLSNWSLLWLPIHLLRERIGTTTIGQDGDGQPPTPPDSK